MKELLIDNSNPTPLLVLGSLSASRGLRPASIHPIEHEAPAAAVAKTVRPAPGWWEALLWTLGFVWMSQFVPMIGLVVLALGAGLDLEGALQAYALPTLFAGQLLGICWSMFGLRVRVGKKWTSAIQWRRPALVPCLLAVLCLPAIVTVASALGDWAGNALDMQEPTRQLVLDGLIQNGFWFCILVVAIGPALGEELFCRGLLGHGLVGRYGVWFGVLFTSLIFGVIHMNVPQGIYAFVLGIGMHLAYLATRSLWVPMLMHFVNNAAAIVMFVAFPTIDSADTHPLWVAVLTIAIAILCGRVLMRLHDRKEAQLQVA